MSTTYRKGTAVRVTAKESRRFGDVLVVVRKTTEKYRVGRTTSYEKPPAYVVVDPGQPLDSQDTKKVRMDFVTAVADITAEQARAIDAEVAERAEAARLQAEADRQARDEELARRIKDAVLDDLAWDAATPELTACSVYTDGTLSGEVTIFGREKLNRRGDGTTRDYHRVSFYVDRDHYGVTRRQVNWSGIGSVSVSEMRAYVRAMEHAAKLGETATLEWAKAEEDRFIRELQERVQAGRLDLDEALEAAAEDGYRTSWPGAHVGEEVA